MSLDAAAARRLRRAVSNQTLTVPVTRDEDLGKVLGQIALFVERAKNRPGGVITVNVNGSPLELERLKQIAGLVQPEPAQPKKDNHGNSRKKG